MKHLATTLKMLLATALLTILCTASSGCSDEKYGIYLYTSNRSTKNRKPYSTPIAKPWDSPVSKPRSAAKKTLAIRKCSTAAHKHKPRWSRCNLAADM